MKHFTFLKPLLMALMLVGGVNCVWGEIVETEIVNCNFESSQTLFTGASRITVSNEANAGIGSKVVMFTCANNSTNGYSLATYDFSAAVGNDASAVKIAFDFYIPNANASYRRFFTIGQTDLRTGFEKQSYQTKGSMFAFGLARNSSANYFSINGASTTAAASATNVLGAWAHAEITADISNKKISYSITSLDGETSYYSGSDIAFTDATASTCNQLDFFDCQNDAVSYLDNLVITKYVDNSKVATTYTVKYQNSEGTALKSDAVYDTYVGDTYTASASDMATFYNLDESKKYVYTSGNTSTTATSTASENVITLVFNEYDKVAYTVTAKDGATTLTTLASGNAYTDGSTTHYWSKYQEVNGRWYVTNTLSTSITAAGNTDIAFSPADDITYFYEMENLTRVGGSYLSENNLSYSNNTRIRLSKGSLYHTPALAAGVYTLTIGCANSNATASEVYVYTRSGEGVLSDVLHTHTATNGNTTLSCTITVPEGYSIAFNGNEGEYNNNARMDYMLLSSDVSLAIADCKRYETSSAFATAVAAESFASAADVYAFHTAWQIAQAKANSSNDITKVIRNAAVADATDWGGASILSGEQYPGAPDEYYFDKYNGSINTNQTIYGVPAGTYKIKAVTRSAVGTSGTLYVNDGSGDIATVYQITSVGNKGGELGNGWSWSEMTFTLTETKNLLIGFWADASSNKWAGCDDWRMEIVGTPVTITSAGWATLYTPYALDFSEVAGLTAYTASLSGDIVTLTEVDDVPANTGVVLNGAAGSYNIPVITSSSTGKGDLIGNATEATAYNAYDDYDLYMLARNGDDVQFTYVKSGSIAAGKAFLKVAKGRSVKAFSVVVGDITTGVQTVEPTTLNAQPTTIFNLAGQRLNKMQKGINIVNGKKVIK